MVESSLLWILGFISVAVVYVINYYNQKYKFWSSKGVVGPKPQIFVGNLIERMTNSIPELNMKYAKKYGKMYGVYIGTKPKLVITDNELIKNVMIKDFHCFMNRDKNPNLHKVMGNNLFSSEEDKWKRMRTITSPSFTSGKLKGMVPLMEKCIDKFAAYFDKVIQEQGGVIDVKKVTSGFTIDVIASTSFATDTNANDDRSGENVFVKNGKEFFDFSMFRILAIILLPKTLLKLLNIRTANNPRVLDFFINLAKEIVRQRKTKKSKHNDLVQLMMDAYVDEKDLNKADYQHLSATMNDDSTDEQNDEVKAESRKTLSEVEIIANSVIFFIAGFETTASTISHCLFELTRNPDVQERLHKEIKEAMKKNESMDFNELVINHIPYLEAVVKETLRMYPPLTELVRRVTVDKYQLKDVTLEKDSVVIVPSYVVHHSEEYYPEPERFNPDRFMPENKHLLVPYTYMPFGQGPRNCVGMRFAYQEIKLCLARLALDYRFNPTPNTPEKLKFLAKFQLIRTNDFQIKLSKR